MRARAHVFISGLVQGVFFRSSTCCKARRLGVKGFVRNLADGRVEAVFEGEKEKVEEIVAWCRKGPPTAKVEKIEVFWEEYKGEFKDFSRR